MMGEKLLRHGNATRLPGHNIKAIEDKESERVVLPCFSLVGRSSHLCDQVMIEND
jgi:hypothetical protein